MKYSKGRIAWAGLVVLFPLVTPSGLKAAPDDGAAKQATAEDFSAELGEIRVAADREATDDISGSLSSPSGSLSFQTESTTSGKPTARGATPDRVIVTLEVNGDLIRHDFDDARRAVTISTPRLVRLEKEDVQVLKTFQQELGKAIVTAENFDRLPRAQELVWRLSEMYSEAPFGITIERMRVIDLKSDPEQNADVGRDAGGDAPAACGQAGGGFIDLHAQCNVCNAGLHCWRSEAHDYCTGPGAHHDYVTTAHQDFGCGSSDCYGRCGGGCGAFGWGVGAWQKDCLDHDRCNRAHGQQFEGCGDEWNEAADDYLNGVIHCAFDHC